MRGSIAWSVAFCTYRPIECVDVRIAWYLAMGLALGGFVATTIAQHPVALTAMMAGGAWLLVIAIQRVGAHRNLFSITTTSAGAAVVITALYFRVLDTVLPAQTSLGLAGIGVQLVIASLRLPADELRVRRTRSVTPAIGHALALAAAALIALGPSPIPAAPLLAAMMGYTLLFVDVLWMRRQSKGKSTRGQSWEALFLLTLSTSLLVAFVVGWPRANASASVVERGLEGLLQLTVLIGLASLADPPGMPRWMTLKPGGIAEFWIDSLTVLVLLESIVLLIFLAAPHWIWPMFFVISAYLVFEVTFEYVASAAGLIHRWRVHRDPPDILHGPLRPITVLVACKQESGSLFRTLPLNLARLPSAKFVVAYAAPDQATSKLLTHQKTMHPGRIQAVPSAGLSKATDLSQAWRHVDTPWCLILDADETLDNRSLRMMALRMESNPRIGVVQARKAARDPEANALSSFIASERRFSTIVDHAYYEDRFGAGHFAGSAALVRQEVPASVGGWLPRSLTEDIEFTARVYRDGRWDITYIPEALVEETAPRGFASFIRQRGRWARGWSEVVGMHALRLLLERRRVGRWRTFGLLRQFVTAVNAPVIVFLPLLGVLWAFQGAPGLPLWATIALAIYIFPARMISYLIAWALDPHRPEKRRWLQGIQTAFWAYAWISMAWLLQLHALYLIVSGAPRTWLRTRLAPIPRSTD